MGLVWPIISLKQAPFLISFFETDIGEGHLRKVKEKLFDILFLRGNILTEPVRNEDTLIVLWN